jgi:hypothetical protein
VDALIRRRPKRERAIVLIALLTSAALSGCSGNDSGAVGSESIVTPPDHLISSADVSKTPVGSAERAFLRYWSVLQYSAWTAAVSAFEPSLVRFIGAPQLVEALKTGSSYFRTVKPTLRGRVRAGDEVIVRYRVENPAGSVVTSSISWRRTPRGWRIHYDPSLDGLLQASAQAQVQTDTDPTAAQPSKRALQAGLAASRVQSQYLGSQESQP